jgi:hypothetical protein
VPDTGSQSSDYTPPLAGSFRKVLLHFREELEGRYAIIMPLSEEGEPRVSLAIQWLLAVRDEEGFWGYQSAGDTALCALAIESWLGLVPTLEQLESTIAWLARAWEDGLVETAWDTGVAGRILYLLGTRRLKTIREVQEQLTAFNPEDDWSGNPHHAAEVLNALAVMEADFELREAWATKLTTLIQTEEYTVSVLGQVVYALLVNGDRSPDSLEDSISKLAHYLENTRMSNAEFLTHVHALRALAATAQYRDVVGLSLDKIFSDAYRQDGSWYHAPGMTAWALLALREAKAVRRVIIELPTFNVLVERTYHEVEALQTQERTERRRTIGVGAALGFSVAVLGGLGIFYAGDSLLITGIVVTALFTVIISSFKFVRDRIR